MLTLRQLEKESKWLHLKEKLAFISVIAVGT